MRVLILGGTAEGRALAAGLHGRPGVEVVSSLAGRTGRPRAPEGPVRVGGFGGAEGLARHLRDEAVDVLVDATHPFAATVSAHAARAAAAVGTRLVTLRRPEWSEQAGDRWIHVADVAEAARVAAAVTEAAVTEAAVTEEAPAEAGCVFVTTGRKDVTAYRGDDRHAYLIRMVEAPDCELPPRHKVLLDRGPYTVEGEGALMDEHGVCVLVTKNSGGDSTAAKITAARLRGIPVVMVDRPVVADVPPSTAEAAADVPEALALLLA